MTTTPGSPSPNTPGAPAPTGVGRTALMVAAARAAESAREDRLFTDPYAADFLAAAGSGEEAGGAGEASKMWDSFSSYLPIRTRFFDDYLRAATDTVRQVVIVAAGLDTRAFRLPAAPEVTVYELDTPDMLAFQQRELDARGARPSSGRRVAVAVDLREDWGSPLDSAGFDPDAPAAWLVEGLVSYLSPGDNDRLLAGISGRSVSGSRLSIEYLHRDTVALMGAAITGGSDT
ncbi:MAG: SAM-dependent methyltransferase, partial [Nocardia sp.]|nr:SAM-dependent methyltransferase [Nocardia sp.]